jgi:hypothetical protein
MISCPNPSCRKALPELSRTCRFCQADLSLLVDFVGELQGALDRAEAWTRAGELDRAVWAYLEVLEADPDNAAARRQVGRVAAAVRQFDQVSSGRRWHLGRAPLALHGLGSLPGWLKVVLVLLLVGAALFCGYQWGSISG